MLVERTFAVKETLLQPECPVVTGNCHTFWFLTPFGGEICLVKDDGMRLLDISGDVFHGIWMQMDTSA